MVRCFRWSGRGESLVRGGEYYRWLRHWGTRVAQSRGSFAFHSHSIGNSCTNYATPLACCRSWARRLTRRHCRGGAVPARRRRHCQHARRQLRRPPAHRRRRQRHAHRRGGNRHHQRGVRRGRHDAAPHRQQCHWQRHPPRVARDCRRPPFHSHWRRCGHVSRRAQRHDHHRRLDADRHYCGVYGLQHRGRLNRDHEVDAASVPLCRQCGRRHDPRCRRHRLRLQPRSERRRRRGPRRARRCHSNQRRRPRHVVVDQVRGGRRRWNPRRQQHQRRNVDERDRFRRARQRHFDRGHLRWNPRLWQHRRRNMDERDRLRHARQRRIDGGG